MKKLLFLVATLALTYINAQVKDEGTPISEALGIERAGVPTISLPKFDVEAEYRKATENQSKTGMWVFARKFKFNLNFIFISKFSINNYEIIFQNITFISYNFSSPCWFSNFDYRLRISWI